MAVATALDGSPEFWSVKIRTNADASILYLSVNGGAEVALDDTGAGAYGTNPPFDEPLVGYIGTGNSAWLQYTKINGFIDDTGAGAYGTNPRQPACRALRQTIPVTLFCSAITTR